jgi:hypothetical protein
MAIFYGGINKPAASTGTQSTILAESGLLNALYGETAAATSAKGEAAALNVEAAGATAEAGQYGIAGDISAQNAQLAQVSGQLQEYQNTRNLMKTLGAQSAGISAAGFANSGSAVDLARSSLQQGLLQGQVIGTNASIEAGGYFQQAAASAAEATAAKSAAATEGIQSNVAGQVAALDTANAAATSGYLNMIPGAGANVPGIPNISAPAVTTPAAPPVIGKGQ